MTELKLTLIYNKMKRTVIFTIFILGVLGGCVRDEFISPYSLAHISDKLYVSKPSGIQLEDYVVQEEVRINVKLEQDATHRIKILDIAGKTVSQEQIKIYEGNNILKVYVNSLPKSSYTVQVTDLNGDVIGSQIFSKK